MPAYVVIHVDVHEPNQYREYMRMGERAVAAHGGRFLARGGRVETLEESWSPRRLVIIEFSDFERAKAWFRSPEYQEARRVREGVATFRAVVVDGAPAPPS